MAAHKSPLGTPALGIDRGWTSCIVAATGPSLTPEVAERCRGHRVIAVNDAWQLLPFADVMYGCDEKWWDIKGPTMFQGERWSSHGGPKIDNKLRAAVKHGLDLVLGKRGTGFCFEPGVIHYNDNSGFQAINLALQFGAKVVRLVGFDMRIVNGRRHFFGDHPRPLFNMQDADFQSLIDAFVVASDQLPPDISIINCTPGSALTCFPCGEL